MNGMDAKYIRESTYDLVIDFMKKNNITCVETIYQSDSIQEKLSDFVAELFEEVEPMLNIEK